MGVASMTYAFPLKLSAVEVLLLVVEVLSVSYFTVNSVVQEMPSACGVLC